MNRILNTMLTNKLRITVDVLDTMLNGAKLLQNNILPETEDLNEREALMMLIEDVYIFLNHAVRIDDKDWSHYKFVQNTDGFVSYWEYRRPTKSDRYWIERTK